MKFTPLNSPQPGSVVTFAREPWLRNRIAEIIHSGTQATDRVSLAVLCGGVACLVVTLALLVAVWRGR